MGLGSGFVIFWPDLSSSLRMPRRSCACAAYGVMIASSPCGRCGSKRRAASATTAASARLAREVPTCCSLLSTPRKTIGVTP